MNPVAHSRQVDLSYANTAKIIAMHQPDESLKLTQQISDRELQGRTLKNCVRKVAKWANISGEQAGCWLKAIQTIDEGKTKNKAMAALRMWFSKQPDEQAKATAEQIAVEYPVRQRNLGEIDETHAKLQTISQLLQQSKFTEALMQAGELRKPQARNWAHSELAAKLPQFIYLGKQKLDLQPKELAEKTEDEVARTKILKKLIIQAASFCQPKIAQEIATSMPVSDQRDHALDIASCITATYDQNAANELAGLIVIADRKAESNERLRAIFNAKETRINVQKFPGAKKQ